MNLLDRMAQALQAATSIGYADECIDDEARQTLSHVDDILAEYRNLHRHVDKDAVDAKDVSETVTYDMANAAHEAYRQTLREMGHDPDSAILVHSLLPMYYAIEAADAMRWCKDCGETLPAHKPNCIDPLRVEPQYGPRSASVIAHQEPLQKALQELTEQERGRVPSVTQTMLQYRIDTLQHELNSANRHVEELRAQILSIPQPSAAGDADLASAMRDLLADAQDMPITPAVETVRRRIAEALNAYDSRRITPPAVSAPAVTEAMVKAARVWLTHLHIKRQTDVDNAIRNAIEAALDERARTAPAASDEVTK